MVSSLKSNVYFVSGAASGIGLATAQALLAQGAYVGVCDVNETALQDAVKTLQSGCTEYADSILSRIVDIRDRSAVQKFLEDTKARFGGRFDGCANVAGVSGAYAHIWEVDSDDYSFVMDVNAKGLFNVLAESLKPGFMEDSGSIVNVASVYAQRGFPRHAPYCAAKHAMIGLTKTAAIEAGSRGIRVNAIAP